MRLPVRLQALPVLLLTAGLLVGLSGCTSEPLAEYTEPEAYTVGVIVSRVQDSSTVKAVLALDMALQDINAAGGVNNRPLRLIVREVLPASGNIAEAVREMLDSNVVAVLSGLDDSASQVVRRTLEPSGRPLLAWAAQPDYQLLQVRPEPVYWLRQNMLGASRALAQYVLDSVSPPRVGVLYRQTPRNVLLVETFRQALQQGGGRVENLAPYPADLDTADSLLDPFLNQLVLREPEAYLLLGDSADYLAYLARTDSLELFDPNDLPRHLFLEQPPLTGTDTALPEELVLRMRGLLTAPDTVYADSFLLTWRANYPGVAPPGQPATAAYDALFWLACGLNLAGTGRLPNLIQGMEATLQARPRFGFNQYASFLQFVRQGYPAGYRGVNRGLQFDERGIRSGGLFPLWRVGLDTAQAPFPLIGEIILDD